ncbi:MAG: hypothetical protein ACI823_001660 [Chitinophagales bacterium]|jgi:hypothetical protein
MFPLFHPSYNHKDYSINMLRSHITLIKSIFLILGMLTVLLLVLGLITDIRSADSTKGGYEYPFTGWSGKTIDFAAMYQTNEGLYKSGYVIDKFFNCNTGMISWEILGVIKGEFRQFSERAIVVHKPQDECKVRGFNSDSWATSDLL